MQTLLRTVSRISEAMNAVAAVVLSFMILLTVADVILRIFKSPIIGTYEMVALSGAVTIGFSIPLTSWMRAHINMDFVIVKLTPRAKAAVNVITKCCGMGLFLILGWNLIILGTDIYRAGEVTPTRHIPFYPMIYGIGICCFYQCIVLFCDMVRTVGGEHD